MRRGLWLTGGVVLTLALIVVASLVGLRFGAVQRALFERAAKAVEEGTGLRLTAQTLHLDPLGSRLEIEGLGVAAGSAEPFLVAERLEIEVAPGALLRSQLVLHEVTVKAPRVDASRPFPEPVPDGGEPARPWTVTVESLRVEDGSATGLQLPEALQPLLGELSADGLELDGRLVQGQLELAWKMAIVTMGVEARLPLDLQVEGEAVGPMAGPLRLARLAVDGDGLSLQADGQLGLESDQPMSLELAAAADLPSLLGIEAAGEPVRLGGQVDLREMSGQLRFEATHLAGELAGPWLGEELLADSRLAGSQLAVAGDITWRGEEVDGAAEVSWQRDGQILATATLASTAAAADDELRGDFTVEVLPEVAGSRRVDGKVVVPVESPAEGRLKGELELSVPDLGVELTRLAELWPAWVPELPADLTAGRWRVVGDLGGQIGEPTVRLEGEWLPSGGGAVSLRAAGAPLSGRAEGEITVAGLSLTPFAEGVRGALSGVADLAWSDGALRGGLSLSGEELQHGETELGAGSLVADLEGWRIAVHELGFEGGGRQLSAEGVLELAPVFSAELELGLAGVWGPTSAAAGRLAVRDGGLSLELRRVELAGNTATAVMSLPLATLATLPGGEGLAKLPGPLADGPLEIEWNQPPVDWASLMETPPAEDGVTPGRWLGGSSGRLSLLPSEPSSWRGELRLTGLEVEQGEHSLRATAPLEMTVEAGRVEMPPATVWVDGHEVELSAVARLEPDWSAARDPRELVAHASVKIAGTAAQPLRSAQAELQLRPGGLKLLAEALFEDGASGTLEARAPWAAMAGGDGTVEARWQLPAADWSGWLMGDEEEEPTLTRLVVASDGDLEIDLERPSRASGELRVSHLEVDLDEQAVGIQEPLELRLADGRLEIASARLLASGAPLTLAGWLELEPEWRLGDPLSRLLGESALSGGGTVPAALLNPFLAGGAGEGTLLAEIEIRGAGEAAKGKVTLSGPGAGFYFVSPYALEIAAPELTVEVVGGVATLQGSAQVNEGRLSFSGVADEQQGVEVTAQLEQVRAVLDYGLLVMLDGDLRLDVGPQGEGVLGGQLVVGRGQLTRPIHLDSLLLDQLLPADLLGTELDPLEGIGLDLEVATREGVRVKNNLADLRVRWEPLAVRGNLVQPVIEGRLEVEPGGLVYAYGQTVRLDSADVVYRGLVEEVPALELQTTTSIEDPSIGQLAGDPFAQRRDEEEGGSAAGGVSDDVLTVGLASFLGERFNRSVGAALGSTRISFRPPAIFGEADPGARLTAASDLSARATVAASVDLRNAERQTYLLDLHDEQTAGRLSAQLFTNDLGNQGGTLQQRLEFGGGRQRSDGPRIRRLSFDRVPGVRRRALRRAAGYRKGDRLGDGATFEMAVAVGELLRQRGYPDARVRVEEAPVPGKTAVELAIAIDSGPRVEFQFTGEPLPKPLRPAVTDLYRGDFYEPTAIEEMRLEAVRAWRSRGHLEPQVSIRRELLADGLMEQRRVSIDSAPGEVVDLVPPRFVGLPPSEAAELALLFGSALRRAELVAGLPAAERRALDGLATLGYPEAEITGRRLSADGRQLTVEVAPGEQLRVAAVEFADTGGLTTEVGEAGGITAGGPVRRDRLARAALEVESELRDAGYLDAEVALAIEPTADGAAEERTAIFALFRGPLYRLSGTDFEGLDSTRFDWARRTAGLTPGEALAPAGLRDARRRLHETGLFSAVGTGFRLGEEGATDVIFQVEEEPRYRVAYGLRWESEEGASLVVDLLDRNFVGRGVDLGLRALWSEEIQQFRVSGSAPGVLGPKSRLELFALAGEEQDLLETGEVVDKSSVEGTVQLGWQLGRRTTGRVYGRYRDAQTVFDDPVLGPFTTRAKRPFLGLQYIFDSRDDRVAPEAGLFASLDLSYSDDSLGGDIRYGRLFGQLHSFRSFGRLAGRRLTWAQSVRLGHAEAFSGQELVDDLLLRAGGEYSVRGYRRESLGPPALSGLRTPSTERNSLLVLNEELRFGIWEMLSGLLFFDAGNVWIDDDSETDIFTSLGVGLRADTPLGLLRLDVAFPFDRRPEIDPEVKLYFGLGNVF